ncbi:heme-binding protein [Mesorhizobium sp. M0207]|uniref:heme-binding protein n=1 Tax=unclassified Mesorhizobium TaxID=325217 RepID=UPI0033395D50
MFRETITLTHDGALKAVAAGAARAVTMGVPQCLVVVDASGEVLASLRMDGARFLSMRTAQAKACTRGVNKRRYWRHGVRSGALSRYRIAGRRDQFARGLADPLRQTPCGRHRRRVGTGEQDFDVAHAALAAVGADVI